MWYQPELKVVWYPELTVYNPKLTVHGKNIIKMRDLTLRLINLRNIEPNVLLVNSYRFLL